MCRTIAVFATPRVGITSAFGPSRHIAPPRDLGRFRGEAEIDGQPSIAEDNAYDPTATSDSHLATSDPTEFGASKTTV
jgi:hypothetical protein